MNLFKNQRTSPNKLYFFRRVLPESARWLISKKKFKDAIKIVHKIAKKNKTSDKVPPNLEDEMTKEQEVIGYSFYEI